MSLDNNIPHKALGTGILEIDRPIVLCGGTSLIGQGKQSTIIKPSASFVGSALIENSVPAPQENFCRHIVVRDLTLQGNSQVDGISFNRTAEVAIDSVEVESCNRGIRLEDSIVVQLNNSRMNDNEIGLSAQNRITTLVVQSTRIRGSKQHNVEIDGPGSYGIQFLQAIIESSGVGKPGLIVGALEGEVKGFSAIGSYFEANRSGSRAQIEFGAIQEGAEPQGTFIGCYITAATPNVADYAIHLKRCRGTNIMSCDFSAHDVASILIDPEAGICGYIEGKADSLNIAGQGKFAYRIQNGDIITLGNVRADTDITVRYGSLGGNTVIASGPGKTVFVGSILSLAGNGLAKCKGISNDDFEANNLTGSTQLVNGDATIVFPTPEKNSLYNAFVTSDTVGQYAVTNKTSAGFDIISSNGTSAANVSWFLIRTG